jgi:hypothetical protein
MSNLTLPTDALCVFVDDTGHEQLAGTSFYGLGACAVLGCEYECLIRAPWSEDRRTVHGDPAAPLHASQLTGNATPELNRTGLGQALLPKDTEHIMRRTLDSCD